MKQSFRTIDRFAVRLTEVVVKYRWAVVLIAFVLAISVATGARHLGFANNYRVFFSQDNPELTAFEDLQSTYTKNDNFLFVIEPHDGEVFTATNMAAVEYLTAQAWKIPYVIRVDSVSNFQQSFGFEDDLVVEDLFRNPAGMAIEELDRRGEIALAEPLLRDSLITSDRSATAINVVLQYPELEADEVPRAVTHARALREQVEDMYPMIDISITGVSMLNNSFMETGMADFGTLIPLMFAVVLVLTMLILRSATATVATLFLIMLSSMIGMGWAGFTGVQLTPISGSAPIIIMTLAVADAVHILLALRKAMREGKSKDAGLIEAMRLNFLPVSITSVTTIVGFLALNFSDSPPFWHLGNITAVGIAAAWVFSITLFPALMSILPYQPNTQKAKSRGELAMLHVADFVIANPRRLLVGLGAAALAFTVFIPTIEFNDQWTRYFDHRIEFRRDTDQALQKFGMYPIEFSVPALSSGGISEPDYLSYLEDFAEFLRAQPEVTHVYSFSDTMKRLNKNLHGDDPDYYRTPTDRDEAAQFLLLYEMSLPYGLDLNDRINIDKSATRVTATLGDVDSIQTREFIENTEAWMQANLPAWMQTNPTSAQVMFTYIAERNVSNMIEGTIAAVVIIAIILMLALQSVRLGLLSLVPNGLPILVTFGAWALMVGEIGFSVAAVASISLGIIVDDTVHLLTKFSRARRELNHDAADAIRYAFSHVGVAVVVNTVILAAGFLVLLSSSFKINTDMGLLTALAIAFALILDFLFLPALLLVADKVGYFKRNEGENKMRKPRLLPRPNATVASLFVTIAMLIPAAAWSQSTTDSVTAVRGDTDVQRKGFEIAARSDRSDRGFGDSQVELEMVLSNAAGRASRRKLKITTLEVTNENLGDKSLVVFDHPPDIKGTALLSHANILDADDQWLFLPALKRVKRISSANKSGPFVGSEFSFEDFTALELNKYDYTWVREEILDGLSTDVVELVPRYQNSGYSRQLGWVDQTFHQVRKIEFYDRRGDLLKTLTLGDYRQYGKVWRSHLMQMINHQTGKSTELIYGEFRFGNEFDQDDFVKARLTRLR